MLDSAEFINCNRLYYRQEHQVGTSDLEQNYRDRLNNLFTINHLLLKIGKRIFVGKNWVFYCLALGHCLLPIHDIRTHYKGVTETKHLFIPFQLFFVTFPPGFPNGIHKLMYPNETFFFPKPAAPSMILIFVYHPPIFTFCLCQIP